MPSGGALDAEYGKRGASTVALGAASRSRKAVALPMREGEAAGEAGGRLDHEPLSATAKRPLQVPQVLRDVVLRNAHVSRQVARRGIGLEQNLVQTLAYCGLPDVRTRRRLAGHRDTRISAHRPDSMSVSPVIES